MAADEIEFNDRKHPIGIPVGGPLSLGSCSLLLALKLSAAIGGHRRPSAADNLLLIFEVASK